MRVLVVGGTGTLGRQIAKRALAEDKTVRQVAREMGVLSDAELAKALDLMAMTKPTP